jgi:hypothetical protein
MVCNDWPIAAHGWACAVDGSLHDQHIEHWQARLQGDPGQTSSKDTTGSQGLHVLALPALTEEVVGAVLTAKVEAIHDEHRRDSLDHLDLPVLRRHRNRSHCTAVGELS